MDVFIYVYFCRLFLILLEISIQDRNIKDSGKDRTYYFHTVIRYKYSDILQARILSNILTVKECEVQ